MLPRARKAYELHRGDYEGLAAAYPQVPIAQRTLFQLHADYIESLEMVWQVRLISRVVPSSDGLSIPADEEPASRPIPASGSGILQ